MVVVALHAGPAQARRAVDGEAVVVLVEQRPQPAQFADQHGNAVHFLDAQLGRVVDGALAGGLRRGHGPHRELVDGPHHGWPVHVHGVQLGEADSQVGGQLAAGHLLVADAHVRAHRPQHRQQADARLVDAHAADGDLGVGHNRRGNEEEGGR